MSNEPSDPEKLTGALEDLAKKERILIALDFDGVQLALVSGRPAQDLGELATPPAGTWLVGSHGAQRAQVGKDGSVTQVPFELSDDEAELLATVTQALEKIAAEREFADAWVEHKPAAAALHTRELAARDAESAQRALAFALAGPGSLPGTYAQPGNQVVEIPVVQATKGQAVAELRHQLRTQTGSAVAVLFAGDDVTDETALGTLSEGDVGVKVGTQDSVARYRVADEAAFAALLQELADLRAQSR